ncbi:MAG: glycosyltransferase family 4 protein [Planctomycetes bacterium]|nr:glycosyltransferase family 4 protein [Planctomycetota bacterium]MBI3845654.1 glycosyltransferase family 4 protein [Planctomycetota bacterium]
MSNGPTRIGVDATVVDARPSGARRRFVEVFRRLVEGDAGAEYRFYAARGVRLADFAPFAEGRTIESPFSPGRPLRRAARGIVWWPRRAAEDDLAVLHAHALPAPNLLARTRVVLTIHDVRALALPDLYSAGRRQLQKLALDSMRRHVARVIVPSEFTKHELVSRASVPEERVVVIPNAPSDVEPRDLAAVRAWLALPERFLLVVAHLEPRKNLGVLLESLVALPGETLVIVGEGRERDRLLRAAESLGVVSRVRIVERLDDADLAAVYRLASIFLFPSLYEGFGIPVLEAMAAGTPVIAAATSAIPEVAGEAAMLLPPSDAGAWANAIRALARDDSSRRALVEAGRARAARFSWDRTANEILGLQRELLAS